jgi:pyridoxal phosphate enzyme (YggS family)
VSDIHENIAGVRARMAAAAVRSGRNPEDVTLVCVSKTRSPREIQNVLEAGEIQLGENRVQEFLEKYDAVQDIAEALEKKPNIMWNLIGHLQRNKVKYITGKVALIHSVDSFKLAEEINARFALAGEPAQVLVQLNPAGEAQKYGTALSECEELTDAIACRLPYVKLRGLMAVVPAREDPDDVRGYFRDVKRMFDALAQKYGGAEAGFEHLSMGMSHDFEAAIEEGSTIVRVGEAIFGPRMIERRV